jgi:hypothetical protein
MRTTGMLTSRTTALGVRVFLLLAPLVIATAHAAGSGEQFLVAGGNVHEYMAAVRAAIDLGYITVHPSGAYLSFTQAGADLLRRRSA